MNGADMKNFIDAGSPFASARIGEGRFLSVSWTRATARLRFSSPASVVNNISLDHKSLDELRTISAISLPRRRRWC